MIRRTGADHEQTAVVFSFHYIADDCISFRFEFLNGFPYRILFLYLFWGRKLPIEYHIHFFHIFSPFF